MYHLPSDDVMTHRAAIKIFQENGVLAFIPLGYIATIDTAAITQIVTSVTGLLVAIFAIRYYIANTKKIEVEREVVEIERDNLLMEKQVTEVSKKKGLKKVGPKKPKEDDE